LHESYEPKGADYRLKLGTEIQREESVTVTFRLTKKIIDLLHKQSEKKKISFNALIGQILDGYVGWEQYKNTGLVSLPRPIVSELFERLDDEQVVGLAKNLGKKAMMDIAFFMNNISGLDSFLRWFELRMQNSSIQVNRTLENNVVYYAFKHDLGRKWSLYYKTILESIFRESFAIPTEVSISDSVFKFRINT
jgi:hypothetical protein